MSTAAKNFLIEHRVKALANVFLMGRNSIATYTIPDFGDVDLLARYLPEGEEPEKLFAVIVKGTASPLNSERDAAIYLNQWASRKHVQYLPFPVLILVFSMVNDEGSAVRSHGNNEGIGSCGTMVQPQLSRYSGFKSHLI